MTTTQTPTFTLNAHGQASGELGVDVDGLWSTPDRIKDGLHTHQLDIFGWILVDTDRVAVSGCFVRIQPRHPITNRRGRVLRWEMRNVRMPVCLSVLSAD